MSFFQNRRQEKEDHRQYEPRYSKNNKKSDILIVGRSPPS